MTHPTRSRRSTSAAAPALRALLPFASASLMLLLLLPTTPRAAEPVAPPSVQMTGEGASVVAAEVLTRPDASHLTLRIVEVIAGAGAHEDDDGENEAASGEGSGAPAEEDEVTIRTTRPGDFADVPVGGRFLVAFTRLANTDQFRDAKFLDPEGPRVLRLRGEPLAAVFPDHAELRFLFARARGEAQPSRRERLDAVLALMQTPSPSLRAFAIEELFIRAELPPVFGLADVQVVHRTLMRPGLPMQLQQFLLDTALRFPQGPTAAWLHRESLRIVRSLGPELNLVTPEALLVTTAMKSIAAVNDRRDVHVVLPMIASNSPPVVRSALDAAHAMNARATLARVEQRLDEIMLQENVHADIRRMLERYLLDRALLDDAAR